MPSTDEYRTKSAELRVQARIEPNSEIKNELEKLARGYDHLAELAEKNRRTDIVYEPPDEILNGLEAKPLNADEERS